MFVRFRQTARRLQASLIVTRRADGRIHHEYIASLGSVPLAPSSADRIAFWTKLHPRLQRLANRLDAPQQAAIMGAVHARIPMPMQTEQHAVLIEHAREDAKRWQQIAEMGTEQAEGLKGLAEHTQQQAAAIAQLAAESTARADEAKERLAKAEAGEVVPVPKPMTRADIRRITGMTEAEMRKCVQVAEIAAAGGFERLLDEQERRAAQAERAVVRKLHRQVVGKYQP
jgi:hypothetical protein